MTSDGFPCYPSAIGASFGPGVDYAQMHKVFRSIGARDDDYRTEQPRHPIVTKHPIFGAPDESKISTSYAERQNGTQRHITGRIRRFVYAFSKKLPNHRAALALGYAWYNLEGTARELPNGRGFLRVVQGGKGAPAAPVRSPDPPPVAAPAASATPADPRQLDLLVWRPKPVQLALFDLDVPEGPKS